MDVRKAIEQSKYYIALATRNFMNDLHAEGDNNVKREVAIAGKLKKETIIIAERGVDISELEKLLNVIDILEFSKDDPTSIERIANELVHKYKVPCLIPQSRSTQFFSSGNFSSKNVWFSEKSECVKCSHYERIPDHEAHRQGLIFDPKIELFHGGNSHAGRGKMVSVCHKKRIVLQYSDISLCEDPAPCRSFKPKGEVEIYVPSKNFSEFRNKVEGTFGNIEELAKIDPDLYAHQVLAHGFIEFLIAAKKGVKRTEDLKELFMIWAKENNLAEELFEKGWEAFLED